MKTKRPAGRDRAKPRRTVDRDGVVRVELQQGSRAFWIGSLGLVAIVALVGLGLRMWGPFGAPPASVGHSSKVSKGNEQKSAVSGGSKWPKRAAANMPRGAEPGIAAQPREDRGDTASTPPDDTEDPEAMGDAPDDDEELEAEAQAGQEKTGIDVFPAPGTKRIKPGIVVPDDFPLPPGYVRHFQATDKGEMLQAILMFHPDHQPVDAQGKPIPLPADRVVPPDMAPPGLPIEYLKVPENAYAEREERGMSPQQERADTHP